MDLHVAEILEFLIFKNNIVIFKIKNSKILSHI